MEASMSRSQFRSAPGSNGCCCDLVPTPRCSKVPLVSPVLRPSVCWGDTASPPTAASVPAVSEAVPGDARQDGGPEPEPQAVPDEFHRVRRQKRSTRNAIEWIAIVAGALIVAVIGKTFLI